MVSAIKPTSVKSRLGGEGIPGGGVGYLGPTRPRHAAPRRTYSPLARTKGMRKGFDKDGRDRAEWRHSRGVQGRSAERQRRREWEGER